MNDISPPTAGADVPPSLQMRHMLLGFLNSAALYTVAELDVPTALLQGPKTVEELAEITRANADVLRRTVRLLTSLGVFRMHEDTVEITDLGATLADGTEGSLRHAARFWMKTHYNVFGDLLHAARTGGSAAEHHLGKPFFDWIAENSDLGEVQRVGMANLTSLVRGSMFDGYRLPGDGTVADIGGNDGSVLLELFSTEPERKGIVFDIPNVVAGAREKLVAAGMGDNVEVVAGNFFESVPSAAIYMLSNVLHDWDDQGCLRILHNIAKAASPGARLVVSDIVIPADNYSEQHINAVDRVNTHHAREVDLIMRAVFGARERTALDWKKLLHEGGFTTDRIIPSGGLISIIETTLA